MPRTARPQKKPWVAQIALHGERYRVTCASEIEAALAYDEMALRLYGPNAFRNIKTEVAKTL